MRIVVLGSTGMAGHVVSLFLEERGYDVYRISRSEKKTGKSAGIDVTDFPALKACLDREKPDAVINCIGLLQRACEEAPDRAVLLNAYLPHWLEHTFRGSRTRVIHLSTDCVFSGDRGGYHEDDLPDGRTWYDRTKALGELRNEKDLTFRMSIIGPDIDPDGAGLFNWFMAQSGEVRGWTGAVWSGVTTVELARGIDAALRTELSGLYQLVPAASISKFALLDLMRTVFDREAVTMVPDERMTVDKSLVNSRRDFAFAVQDYSGQIADMKCWINEHLWLYPHYV